MVKIMPNIWLGSLGQAIAWRDTNPNGVILCVADSTEFALNRADHTIMFVPILRGGWDKKFDVWDTWVEESDLGIACGLLDFCTKKDYDVAVCCAMGQERSPLTIAWYMHTYRNTSLDDAFTFLKAKKSDIIDRRDWLENYSKEKHEERQKDYEKVFDPNK